MQTNHKASAHFQSWVSTDPTGADLFVFGVAPSSNNTDESHGRSVAVVLLIGNPDWKTKELSGVSKTKP
jgi:hypothetical protein